MESFLSGSKTLLAITTSSRDDEDGAGGMSKWFADTAEAYYDLEEWHPFNPTPGLTAKGRAESLYTLSRQLKQEADAILARERAMEFRKLGTKVAKPLPSPCTGKRKAEDPDEDGDARLAQLPPMWGLPTTGD